MVNSLGLLEKTSRLATAKAAARTSSMLPAHRGKSSGSRMLATAGKKLDMMRSAALPYRSKRQHGVLLFADVITRIDHCIESGSQ
jgi:NADH:ubiquinone oxidoreductase subunit B-like Fe-S oxidoreductase